MMLVGMVTVLVAAINQDVLVVVVVFCSCCQPRHGN